jgi:hypothetical protein
MERFKKSEFLRNHGPARALLCHQLGQLLSERLRREPDFHRKVQELVSELRLLGHDLWSFDESDEMEAWSPNYETSTGPGIVVTFKPDAVNVEWSNQ